MLRFVGQLHALQFSREGVFNIMPCVVRLVLIRSGCRSRCTTLPAALLVCTLSRTVKGVALAKGNHSWEEGEERNVFIFNYSQLKGDGKGGNNNNTNIDD